MGGSSLGHLEVAVAVVVVPYLQELLQSYVQIYFYAVGEDTSLYIEHSWKRSLEIFVNGELQAILFALYHCPLAIEFECDAVAFIFGYFVEAVTFAGKVQSIKLFSVVLIQSSEDVVTPAFSVDYRVPFFPTCHYEVKSTFNRKLSVAHFHQIIIVDFKSEWQFWRQLFSVLSETEVVLCDIDWKMAFEVLEQSRIVGWWVVEVVQCERKHEGLNQLVLDVGQGGVDGEVTDHFTFLEDDVTHSFINFKEISQNTQNTS